jgi:outer membrane protein assembly factor BamB
MPRPKRSLLFVGIKSYVIAMDRASGAEVWRTQLPAKYRNSAMLVTVLFDGEGLYASIAGEVFALNPKTGELLWHEPFKGLGTGFVTMTSELGIGATASRDAASAAVVMAQRAAAAAAT